MRFFGAPTLKNSPVPVSSSHQPRAKNANLSVWYAPLTPRINLFFVNKKIKRRLLCNSGARSAKVSSKLIIFQAACAYVYASGTVVQSGELRGVLFLFYFFHTYYFPASGQAMVTGVVHSSPRFSPSIFHGFSRVLTRPAGRIKVVSKSRRSGRFMTRELFSADPRVKPADLARGSAFFKLYS